MASPTCRPGPGRRRRAQRPPSSCRASSCPKYAQSTTDSWSEKGARCAPSPPPSPPNKGRIWRGRAYLGRVVKDRRREEPVLSTQSRPDTGWKRKLRPFFVEHTSRDVALKQSQLFVDLALQKTLLFFGDQHEEEADKKWLLVGAAQPTCAAPMSAPRSDEVPNLHS